MFTMRSPCQCGSTTGRIEKKGAQDCVYCLGCGAWKYNAPRSETGSDVRSVSRSPIKPSKRSAILLRATGRCELCGRKPDESSELHVGHILSVKDAEGLNLTKNEIDSPENLAAMCDECNLGIGEETIPLRLAVAIVKARTLSRNE